MKILNGRDSFLSNYEVQQHMTSIKSAHNWLFDQSEDIPNIKSRARSTAGGLDLEVITRDVLGYLAAIDLAPTTEEASLVALGEFLNNFDLVKVEKLQIVNSLPRTMVHLYALVEECGLRFDEDVCTSIIHKIDELFPLPELPKEDDENIKQGDDDEILEPPEEEGNEF